MADRAFDAPLRSTFLTLDGNFEFFKIAADTVAVALQLVFGESASFRFNVDAAGTTDNVEVAIMTGHRISSGNTFDAVGSTTSFDLDTAAGDTVGTDDDLNGTYIVITSGAAGGAGEAEGEGRLITNSAATNDNITLDHAVTTGSDTGTTYDLYRLSEQKFIIDMSSAIGEDNPLNDGVTVNWMSGEFILVRAQATGATDAHRIQMSYQKDSGPA